MKKWIKHWELWREGILMITFILIIYKLIANIYPIWLEIQSFFGVIRPFVMGLIIAYLLNGPCNKIEAKLGGNHKKSARGLSVLIVYLLMLSVITLIVSYIIPIIVLNIYEFVEQVPQYTTYFIENLDQELSLVVWGIDMIHQGLLELMTTETFFAQLGIGLTSIGEYALVMTTGILHFFLSIIVSIYFLIYKHKLLVVSERLAIIVIKKRQLQTVKNYLHQFNDIFYKFIAFQALDSCIISIISITVLSLLGVNYAFTLGVLLGVCNMIPYFGSIFASILTVAITIFTGGAPLALITGVFLLFLQQIDGSVIGPRLMGDALNLNPILIIFSITIGGAYFGILGMFLSVPIAAIAKILISHGITIHEQRLR